MEIQIRDLKKSQFIQITKKLTVYPNAHSQNQYQYGPPDKFCVYRASKETQTLVIPRFFSHSILQEVGCPLKPLVYEQSQSLSDSVPHHIHSDLRPHQKTSIEHIEKAYSEKGGGMLCLGCGLGKTVVAIEMIARTRKKTMVIVHKEFLMNQWKERIETFLPEAKVGVLYQNKNEVDGSDIVIAMLQSLSMKEYESDLFTSFGHLIVDECHHIAAKVFSKAMFKIHAQYILGLSATPDRKDGLICVLKWFLGDIVFSMESTKENQVCVYKVQTDTDIPVTLNKMGKLSLPTMVTDLSQVKERNALIVEWVLKLMENEKRYILVLSDRRDQLKELHTMLGDSVSGLYIGGMKQSHLDETTCKRVMLSTFSMTSEAFDQPQLNTLLFATPKTDIEQSMGRILRKHHTDVDPHIIDFVDAEVGVFKVQYYQRHRLYKHFGYEIRIGKGQTSSSTMEDEDHEVEPKREPVSMFDSDSE